MKNKKSVQRMCVSCRKMKDKTALIRVVTDPDGGLSPDLTGKKQCRGAYVCADAECIEDAGRRHSLERSLGCRISKSAAKALTEELKAIAAGQSTDDDGVGSEGRADRKR